MGYPVRYRCPRCEAVAELEREGYLADHSVTPFPYEGWSYVSPDENYEVADADGVRFVCGADADVFSETEVCGRPFYLSFVRYEDGVPVDPPRPSEFVEINTGPRRPRGPPGPSP